MVYLQVLGAGLTLVAGSIVLLTTIVNLTTAIVNARTAGARKGDSQHGPLVIVVRGIGPGGVFYEEQALEVDIQAPPTEKTVEESLTDVIKLIAEERAQREIAQTGKLSATSEKTKRTKRGQG